MGNVCASQPSHQAQEREIIWGCYQGPWLRTAPNDVVATGWMGEKGMSLSSDVQRNEG